MGGKRSFGSVRRLPSGRWQARYRDRAGRLRPAPTTFLTKADAQRYLAVVEAEQARGLWIDPLGAQVTFEAWATEWLNGRDRRRNTVVRDRQALRKYAPVLGSRRLRELTPAMLGEVVRAEAAKVGKATAVRDFAVLRAVLNSAVEADLLARSPLRGVRLAAPEPPDRPTLTPAELERLARAHQPRHQALILLAGWTGLRWSEAIGLRVRDLDFGSGAVRVERTLSEVSGHLHVDALKSRASRRVVALPPFLLEELRTHLAAHRSGAGADDLIFVGRNGAALRRSFAKRHFAPAVRAAGVDERLTFHGLRHVAASLMVDAGEHPKVMQSRLGHATSRLTMDLYAHVSDDADRAAAARLERRRQLDGDQAS